MFRKISVILLGAFVSACSQYDTEQQPMQYNTYKQPSRILAEAEQYAQILRAHFLGQDIGIDLSTLIAQTRSISTRLKRAGKLKIANQFDSYTDVLMYGNNTLDESINDVIRLVRNGYIPNEDTTTTSTGWF